MAELLSVCVTEPPSSPSPLPPSPPAPLSLSPCRGTLCLTVAPGKRGSSCLYTSASCSTIDEFWNRTGEFYAQSMRRLGVANARRHDSTDGPDFLTHPRYPFVVVVSTLDDGGDTEPLRTVHFVSTVAALRLTIVEAVKHRPHCHRTQPIVSCAIEVCVMDLCHWSDELRTILEPRKLLAPHHWVVEFQESDMLELVMFVLYDNGFAAPPDDEFRDKVNATFTEFVMTLLGAKKRVLGQDKGIIACRT